MRRRVLDYLVCPGCQCSLECRAAREASDGEVIEGALCCPRCAQRTPIVRGIPRFVESHPPLGDRALDTVSAFGWEWQTFSELADPARYTEQFREWIHPLEPEFLASKIVLDAGCGMGRFSRASEQCGAELVLAIDASGAVDAAYRNTRAAERVEVIQADLQRAPFRRGSAAQIDFAFSIGVLHHLDDPRAGFRAVASHVRPGGAIFAWVYGRENNGWIVYGVNPIRTVLTSRLPRAALFAASLGLSLLLHPAARTLARLRTARGLRSLARRIPYSEYLGWLGRYALRHTHAVVFDHLVAPVAFYIRREEFEEWFRAAGLRDVEIRERNGNSWRGFGVQPDKEISAPDACDGGIHDRA